VYFSTDNMLDGGDTLLIDFSNAFQFLAMGGNLGRTGGATLPAVTPGGYFLIANGDVNASIFESNETNNTLVQPITVTP
jgi:hypothetical protein